MTSWGAPGVRRQNPGVPHVVKVTEDAFANGSTKAASCDTLIIERIYGLTDQ